MNDLSKRAKRCLLAVSGQNDFDVAKVAARPRSWYLRQPNVGLGTVGEIQVWLSERGARFADEPGRIRRIPARHPIRHEVVWVRLTEAEKAVISEQARAHGKSMAVYLRELGLVHNLNRT